MSEIKANFICGCIVDPDGKLNECDACIRIKALETQLSNLQAENEKIMIKQMDSLQKQVQQMLAVVEAAEKLVVHCNHKPEGWDNLEKAVAEFRKVDSL